MVPESSDRRLAAIMFTDIAGYTALMGRDETAGRRVRERHEAVVRPLVARYHGEWLEERGDESLSILPSALDAVNCALAIQQDLEDDPDLKLRIGVHSGDVTFERGRVIGDGVNVASRIRALAEPGGICISAEVWQTVRNQPNVEAAPLGERELKHVDRPVAVYAVSGTAAEPTPPAQFALVPARRSQIGRWAAAVVGVVVVAGLALGWWQTRPPESASIRSLAVLPFVNMSGDPEQEFFSDGISEELLNVLARIKGLRVTSRTSAFAFKGEDISIPEIAAQLDVEHVLEGSVRMAGNRVRITTQLVEVETDSHLWSESYDRELSDIFAVQDEIAAKVGEALKVALLDADSSAIRPSPETSIEVYSDYLLARQKLANMSYANAEESERLLKGVIERDPGYEPAYAALGETYWAMAGWGVLSSSEASARMMPLVEKALSLDDRLAETWQLLAYVRRANDDFEGARAAGERALELDPRNPLVLRSQIRRWERSHEPERGLVYADELLRVDPLYPRGLRAIAELYARLGRFDDSERMIERIRSIDPKEAHYIWGAYSLAISRGDLVTALRLLEEATRIDSGDPEGPSFIATTYLDLGDVVAAEFWNDAALRLDPEAPWVRLMATLLHLYHDEEAEAVAIARELTRPGSHNRFASRGIALRMVAASDLAAGNYEEIIARYLIHYPELADGLFPTEWLLAESLVWEVFIVTLDLASAYLHAGEEAKAESLLSLVESELPHWSPTIWGYGIADVELHALRGEKEQALAVLREHAAMGMRYMWRWQLLYNPNLESIRDTPKFAAIVAEIKADMAAQLERVREMERRGELALPAELPTPRDHASGSSPTDPR